MDHSSSPIKISDQALYEDDEAWMRRLQLSIMPAEDDDEPTSVETHLGDVAPNLQHVKRTIKADRGCQKVYGHKHLRKTEIQQLEQYVFTQVAQTYPWLSDQQQTFREILDYRAFLPLMIRRNHACRRVRHNAHVI